MLVETELNVLTRQYEKALTDYYETQLQLKLLPVTGGFAPTKEEFARRTDTLEHRLNLLQDWQNYLKERILQRVKEQNDRQTELQRHTPKPRALQGEKAPSTLNDGHGAGRP